TRVRATLASPTRHACHVAATRFPPTEMVDRSSARSVRTRPLDPSFSHRNVGGDMPASATRTPPHDDFELVRRVCSGDRSAASILFSDVLGPLLARLSIRWQYPDLSQDLYVRLSTNDWAALRTWAGRASLTAWARTVAVREYLARTRRARGSDTIDP